MLGSLTGSRLRVARQCLVHARCTLEAGLRVVTKHGKSIRTIRCVHEKSMHEPIARSLVLKI